MQYERRFAFFHSRRSLVIIFVAPENLVKCCEVVDKCAGEASVGKLEGSSAGMPGGGGEFKCEAAYPIRREEPEAGSPKLAPLPPEEHQIRFHWGGHLLPHSGKIICSGLLLLHCQVTVIVSAALFTRYTSALSIFML